MNHDELIAEALIGEEARKFIESDLGKVVLGIADQQVSEALAALEDADPSDVKQIMALQNKARAGRQFRGWLIELINAGENALEVYKNESKE